MQKQSFADAIDEILRHDSRYDRDSYYFVREGLDYTLKLHKKSGRGTLRHVSGQELLEGLRRFALDQFGPMTKTVLGYWGVKRCEDFGEVVFNMVENDILGKTDRDSRADFKGGYDFEEAFIKPFLPSEEARTRKDAAHGAHGSNRYRKSGTSRSASSGKLSGSSN